MTVVGVAFLLLAIAFSPSHGVLARVIRRRALARDMARDDILALLFRLEELRPDHAVLESRLDSALVDAPGRSLRSLMRDGLVRVESDRVTLTDPGRAVARGLIRSHRLWESWLVKELGLRPDHVHDTAERLEHLRTTDGPLRPGPDSVSVDPHDRPIPDADGSGELRHRR